MPHAKLWVVAPRLSVEGVVDVVAVELQEKGLVRPAREATLVVDELRNDWYGLKE